MTIESGAPINDKVDVAKVEVPTTFEEFGKSTEQQAKRREQWDKYKKVRMNVLKWRSSRSEARDKEEAEQSLRRFQLVSNLSEDAQKLSESYHDNLEENDSQILLEAYYGPVDSEESYNMFRQEALPTAENDNVGWLQEFTLLKENGQINEDVTVVDFFAAKLRLKLNERRIVLMESRSLDLAIALGSAEEDSSIQEKQQKIFAGTNDFFLKNNEAISQKIREGEFDFSDMQSEFRTLVFGADYQAFTASQRAEANRYFFAVMDDYVQMEFEIIDRLPYLPVIIDALYANKDFKGWQESIERERKRLTTKKEDEKEVKQDLSTALPIQTDSSSEYVDFTPESIAADSQISIQEITPGEFEIVYNSGWRSKFRIINVKAENGQIQKKYLFEDPFRDSNLVEVKPQGFERAVKSVYFDRIMNQVVEKGRDYLGPNLDAFLSDEKMEQLADKLFFPRKLESIALSETFYIDAFRKMIVLITSDANKADQKGDYGDLRSIQERINLFNHVLTDPSKADLIRRGLNKFSDTQIKQMTLSEFMKSLKIEATFGNISR